MSVIFGDWMSFVLFDRSVCFVCDGKNLVVIYNIEFFKKKIIILKEWEMLVRF